jgi:hypothetical protein
MTSFLKSEGNEKVCGEERITWNDHGYGMSCYWLFCPAILKIILNASVYVP